ncbi:MAG: lysophospholipid acyltransferase family protein [Gemmatimonadetes bacterium]|nr:lysophospholipid acyltransferase family protein [Gemmatimonadota bacterium]
MDRYDVAASAAGLLLDGLFATVRYEVRGFERHRSWLDGGGAVVYVMWHGRLLPLAHNRRDEGHVCLVSRSRDGEYLTRLLTRWGFGAVRGSSSRGGSAALREMVRLARRGRSLCVTPDGPRGPRERLKPGALLAAQVAGLPVVPCASGTRRAWWIEGWDRFLVPKPFARIRIAYGEPVMIPRSAGREELASIAADVERELGRLMAWVDGEG